jgi:hypothetical protein
MPAEFFVMVVVWYTAIRRIVPFALLDVRQVGVTL